MLLRIRVFPVILEYMCLRVRVWDSIHHLLCKCLMCVFAGVLLLLVDVVYLLWQDVQECDFSSMRPPSRNDEDNIKAENHTEVSHFASGWDPYKAL